MSEKKNEHTHCIDCKWLTFRHDKTWCDIKSEPMTDTTDCDKWKKKGEERRW